MSSSIPGLGRVDYRAIYDEHAAAVMRLLAHGFSYRGSDGQPRWTRIRSTFDLEDLTQETFLQVFRQIDNRNYDPSRPLRPYLLRIATNLALRRQGKAAREPLWEDQDFRPVEVVHATMEEDLDRDACHDLIVAFSRDLEGRERQVFDGYLAEDGVTQAEAAQRLNLSRDQVARCVLKIRKKAVRYLERKGWFDES